MFRILSFSRKQLQIGFVSDCILFSLSHISCERMIGGETDRGFSRKHPFFAKLIEAFRASIYSSKFWAKLWEGFLPILPFECTVFKSLILREAHFPASCQYQSYTMFIIKNWTLFLIFVIRSDWQKIRMFWFIIIFVSKIFRIVVGICTNVLF